jgi:hypothetical protein
MMKLKKTVNQRQLEDFEDALNRDGRFDELTGLSKISGRGLRAAIEAGWIEGVDDPAVVDGMSGGEVRKIFQEVNKFYAEATAIDPN